MPSLRKLSGIAAILVLLLTACGQQDSGELDPDEARPVTSGEAERLAISQFNNFDAGIRSVEATVTEAGSTYSFYGWFDYTEHFGYGELTHVYEESHAEEAALLLWDEAVISLSSSYTPTGEDPPLPAPDITDPEPAWGSGSLTPDESRLHTLLIIVGSLGAERPDNPLLLQQGGALYLGDAAIEGSSEELTVFAGPGPEEEVTAGEEIDPQEATTRFWIDENGIMHRVDIRLGGSKDWTTIQLGEAENTELGDPFGQVSQE